MLATAPLPSQGGAAAGAPQGSRAEAQCPCGQLQSPSNSVQVLTCASKESVYAMHLQEIKAGTMANWWVGDRPEFSSLGPLHLSDDRCSVSEVMNA